MVCLARPTPLIQIKADEKLVVVASNRTRMKAIARRNHQGDTLGRRCITALP